VNRVIARTALYRTPLAAPKAARAGQSAYGQHRQ
jgi:hypothetical protein